MLLEPKFDDPSRTADYGYFANERNEPAVITGDDMAYAIMTGMPIDVPMNEWLPKLVEGWIFAPSTDEGVIRLFNDWLRSENPLSVSDAMDILNDVAFRDYGAEA